MTRLKYVQKRFLKENIYVRSKFSSVRSSHDLCGRAQLRGNIDNNTDQKILQKGLNSFYDYFL